MPALYRLEYLGQEGWVVGHAGVALLNPQGYVDRLADKGKFGRATELDDRLQPTGTVYEPPNLPDPTTLVPSSTRVPQLPSARAKDTTAPRPCKFCEEYHPGPTDGSCLL